MSSNVALETFVKDKLRRIEFLKKLGLLDLNLAWPETVGSSADKVDYIKKNPKSINQMYGESDLSKLPIFQGGFINFGYWSNAISNYKKLTVKQRIEASKEMYRIVGDLAEISKGKSILDIGCGLGYGSEFFSRNYHPKWVIGLDISEAQVDRAKECHVLGINADQLRFTIGEAESMPFTDASFDCVVSVEAAQHFVSISAFAKEASRILKPGGKLVLASFFPKNKEGLNILNAVVPDYHIHGSQYTTEEVHEELSAYMRKVKISSIGENVWHGFSRWLDRIGYQNQWSKIWLDLYTKGFIDYVIFEAIASEVF